MKHPTGGGERMPCLEYLVGYSFIIKRKVKREKRLPSSSAFPPSGEGFSCPYMVKPGLSWHYGKIISGLSTMRSFTLKCCLSINYCIFMCEESMP